jgi:transposase
MAVDLPAGFEGWGKPKQITARLPARFGTDPRLRQSGKWTGRVKISKRGIGAARTARFQAAFCSLANDPENAAYYQALRRGDGPHRRPKAHKEAIVDVMRKQLRCAVSVPLANQSFVAKPHPAA